MAASITSILSKPIVDILKKSEHTSAEIQNEIRFRHKQVYSDVNETLLKEGRKSSFDKCVDGTLNDLKNKGVVALGGWPDLFGIVLKLYPQIHIAIQPFVDHKLKMIIGKRFGRRLESK